MRRLLIAGIDSGLNVGIALIDIDGRLVCIEGLRSAAYSDVIKEIMDYGSVIAVSTDKTIASKSIKSIASSISAELVLPKRNLTKKKKRLLIDDFTKHNKNENNSEDRLNSHEKSALASAIYAYKRFVPKMKKLRDKVKDESIYLRARERFLLERIKISEIA